MKRILISVIALFAMLMPARADEGMWLPVLIGERIGDMQAKGLRISAEEIYSVNQASLKDAIVLFGSGCTGELVSDKGLLFTNHHCGFSYIQKHSSVEHDYLKDGFWALSQVEELPNPGLTVSFLVRMEDVTDAVLEGYDPDMSETDRETLVKANSKRLRSAAEAEGPGIKASVEALYYGNQYFLFVFRVYRDVRLVGAPPSSIGKFGGETDNWMWPRHTGDFSIFRIYSDKDGNPADYSPENVPYQPRKSFKISRAGVKEGDFTFVYGCPGSTQEYVLSDHVRYVGEISDPEKIALRTMRLNIQKKYMSAEPAVRIKYASKNASIANAWKKWQGEEKGLRRNHIVEAKQAYEARFNKWAKGTEYEGLVGRLRSIYKARQEPYRAYEYYNETVRTIEIVRFASTVRNMISSGKDITDYTENFFKDYDERIDREIFVAMMQAFVDNIKENMKPAWMKAQIAKYGSVEAWGKALFDGTLFTDKAKVLAADYETAAADPAAVMDSEFTDWLYSGIYQDVERYNADLRLANREYMRAQMEFEPKRQFYPDANLTLRIAYGHVEGYRPADGVYYRPVSTLKGIIEKDNPDIYDYNIPQVLRDIYAQGGHEDQPVCFLATNHTTGGNSGSPVLNADGNLIGINFDRVWEGTMSDLAFDPAFCRNISLDVRYLLFVIKEIGHADYLFDEMTFVD